MKVLSDLKAADYEPPQRNTFTLPQGIIGFTDHTQGELLYIQEHLPFLWLKITCPGQKEGVHFIVLEPAGFIPGYEPELFDEDAESIGIKDPAEAMILNIVAMGAGASGEASVNLVGPIVVNRRTRVGRQLVIANYQRYSAHHPLTDVSAQEARASA